MAIFNIFSKRQKKLRGEVLDIYVFDQIPNKLRVQIVHIIRNTIGRGQGASFLGNAQYDQEKIYGEIHKSLCQEYGVFSLGERYENQEESLFNFLLKTDNIEQALDVVELAFRLIEFSIKRDYNYSRNMSVETTPDEAIEELNERFKENGVGYYYKSGKIIRVDSEYTHAEITKPTLNLLWNPKFAGANDEYLKAHEHYRHGRNKECLVECLKAFESTLKTICDEKGWEYNQQKDGSAKLIKVCLDNGLIPSYAQSQFASLRSLLESGIPTIRNKTSGHGQGATPQKVDDEITRYGLNLTGSNIIFLIEQSGIS